MAVFALGQALALGLASGPACVASCGPVVIPSLLAERAGLRINVRYLSTFLATRLLGYLVFATVAWELGALLTLPVSGRLWVFATIHLLLGFVLLWYAYSVGRSCTQACAGSELVTIDAPAGRKVPAAGALGFLTGVSLCPPFVAAGVRAAEAANLVGALVFFTVFFAGTSIWFLPLAGMSWIKRNEAVTTVTRMAMVLIAFYYIYLGLTTLIGSKAYGH